MSKNSQIATWFWVSHITHRVYGIECTSEETLDGLFYAAGKELTFVFGTVNLTFEELDHAAHTLTLLNRALIAILKDS